MTQNQCQPLPFGQFLKRCVYLCSNLILHDLPLLACGHRHIEILGPGVFIPLSQPIQADIGGNARQPSGEARFCRIVARGMGPKAQQRLLSGFLGKSLVAEHPPSYGEDARHMPADQRGISLPVTGRGTNRKRGVHVHRAHGAGAILLITQIALRHTDAFLSQLATSQCGDREVLFIVSATSQRGLPDLKPH